MKTKKKKKLTPAQYALKAAKFLETHKWIRGDEALDAHLDPCSPRSSKAVSFCAVGAIKAVGGSEYVVDELMWGLNYKEALSLVDYNDSVARRKSQVINRLRRIAREV